MKPKRVRTGPIETKVLNLKSNTRRFERDLLPKIRGLCHVPEEIPNGHPVARWMVSMVILKSLSCWKTAHALNYAQVRSKLAEKAGGYDQLVEIEDHVFETAGEIHEGMQAA